jgi:exosome complex RNA-binding protein Rrp4
MTANEAVTPGCFLGTLSQYQPGEGVYVREDKIYSSLVGFKTVLTSPQHKVCI